MTTTIDGVLVQWGDRLFYPGNRRVPSPPGAGGGAKRSRAAHIRVRIAATVARRAPQVMVKVTGGGRGMGAIAAHLRYISKGGRLSFEDDRCIKREGREALHDLVEQWRFGGERIPEISHRREAFNIMLSMPAGTPPEIVHRAAREFAQAELAGHRYVMVLHTHQANPHVHLSVRASGREGQRLNPRKADLHRWRETFAERLRGWGIEAEASPQATRGVTRRSLRVWERQPGVAARTHPRGDHKTGVTARATRGTALEAWAEISKALAASGDPADHQLSRSIGEYLLQSDVGQAVRRRQAGLGLGPEPNLAPAIEPEHGPLPSR